MPDREGALALLWATVPINDSLSRIGDHSPLAAAQTLVAEESVGVFSKEALRGLAGHEMVRATQLAGALAVVWLVAVGAHPLTVAGVLVVFVAAGIGEQYTRLHWIWAAPRERHASLVQRRAVLIGVAVVYAALAVLAFSDVAPVGRPLYVLPGVAIIVGLGLVRAVHYLRQQPDCADPPDPPKWPEGSEAYALVATLAKAESMTPAWHEAVTGQPGYLISSWVDTLSGEGLIATERTWNGHLRRVRLTAEGRGVLDLARDELRSIAGQA